MSGEDSGVTAYTAAELVARRSYGKLVAFLAARTHDVAAVEDALADAFAAALADWPRNGCPTRPEAWLLTVARRRIIDAGRRRRTADAATQAHETPGPIEAAVCETDIPDRRLALLFTCAHPAIDAGIRAPLMLQTVLGLDAQTIASAFLTSPSAMAKRLGRAKEKIRSAGVPFRIPDRDELAGRLDSVLDAIYAAFTEGWADANGTDATRRDLTGEAIFLSRLVTEMLPEQAEGLGLLALMLYADSRRRARRTEEGEYVPLDEQNPRLWDSPMMAEAEGLLRRATAIGRVGRYQTEAALQSAHAHRRLSGVANWPEIVQLYDVLFGITGSPVVAINRALAVAETEGATVALNAIKRLAADTRVESYQPYWATRAELSARTGAYEESRRAYEIAIGLEQDPAVRRFLERRRSGLPV